MYNEFFGLQKAPFQLTPDPTFLYLTEEHRDALAGLTYAIMGRKGFVVLTGDAGTGKTTVLTRILGYLPVTRIQFSVIVNPTLTPTEFLEAALLDFGFTDIPASKPKRIAMLQNFLWKGHCEGKVSVLVIDEAHKLSTEVLEEVRLLGNFESAGEKLLQIVLVGQSELDELLNRENLRQLKQRISLRLAITALAEEDVKRYVEHRWVKAGGNRAPFSPDALASVANASSGIPRLVNVICDNALLEAFEDTSRTVELRHVVSACKGLRLLDTPRPVKVAEIAPIGPSEPGPAPDFAIKTLQRYSVAAPRRSLLGRLALKLGFTHRIETA